MRPLDTLMREKLNTYLESIGSQLNADSLSTIGPILDGRDSWIRDAIEMFSERQDRIVIILETPGGIVEVVERIVSVIRNFYGEVIVIVPNQAMSAGTVLALSADRIMMNYFSRLGPIDPQIVKDDRLVPALSYLNQYEKLCEKSARDELTTAEYALLKNLDLGELYQFEQARELSIELLVRWLSQYKFKDWTKTETRGISVTQEMKLNRAKEIAQSLNNTNRWHSHARGIAIDTLKSELRLRIDDYSENKALNESITNYYNLLGDYMTREKLISFVHTKEYF